uniref:Uncharacterized protein n=1 Tax=Anguilla anguilla TaxID=7936 RepID=A0A0E9T6U2_ANGAN
MHYGESTKRGLKNSKTKKKY